MKLHQKICVIVYVDVIDTFGFKFNINFIYLLLKFLKLYLKIVFTGAIPKLENGFVEFLEFGKGYRFDCEEGYQLVGQSEIYYENNKWSDHIPICVRKYKKK